LQLRISEAPVHYQRRVHGRTKMKRRFQNGLIMLRMCLSALKQLKSGNAV
jgi:hypothetical protein